MLKFCNMGNIKGYILLSLVFLNSCIITRPPTYSNYPAPAYQKYPTQPPTYYPPARQRNNQPSGQYYDNDSYYTPPSNYQNNRQNPNSYPQYRDNDSEYYYNYQPFNDGNSNTPDINEYNVGR